MTVMTKIHHCEMNYIDEQYYFASSIPYHHDKHTSCTTTVTSLYLCHFTHLIQNRLQKLLINQLDSIGSMIFTHMQYNYKSHLSTDMAICNYLTGVVYLVMQ